MKKSLLHAYFFGNLLRSEFAVPFREMTGLLQKHGWQFSSASSESVWNDKDRKRNVPREQGIPDHFLLRSKSVPDNIDLCVLCQSWPGEYSAEFVLAVKRRNPSAPIILLAGAAAEGDARTGKIPPGVFRLYVHQWSSDYLAEWGRFFEKRPSIFALPDTFEAEDVILFQAERTRLTPSHPSHDDSYSKISCCIVSHFGPFGNDSAMNAMLGDFFRQRNVDVIVGLAGIDAHFDGLLLVDSDDSPFPRILEAAQRLRHDFAGAEIEIRINSPRSDEKVALEHIGVTVRAKSTIFR